MPPRPHRATANIQHCRRCRRHCLIQVLDDMHGGQEVKRSVEQCESGSLSGAVERPAASDGVASLDVGRRHRAECARQLGQPEIGEMALLERSNPLVEGHGQMTITSSASNGMRDSDRVTGIGQIDVLP